MRHQYSIDYLLPAAVPVRIPHSCIASLQCSVFFKLGWLSKFGYASWYYFQWVANCDREKSMNGEKRRPLDVNS